MASAWFAGKKCYSFQKPWRLLAVIAVFALIGGGLGSVLTWFLYGFSFASGISAPLALRLFSGGITNEFLAQLTASGSAGRFRGQKHHRFHRRPVLQHPACIPPGKSVLCRVAADAPVQGKTDRRRQKACEDRFPAHETDRPCHLGHGHHCRGFGRDQLCPFQRFRPTGAGESGPGRCQRCLGRDRREPCG